MTTNSGSAANKPTPTCDFEEAKSAPLWANILANLNRRLPAGKYRIIEWIRRAAPKPFLARLPKELGGYRFHFSIHDNIGTQAFFAGCYEAQESAFARRILQPGMTFVDVGANWGFFSLVAAHLVGSHGRIISLEPDPRCFVRLKANIQRNRLSQVEIFELAAADREANWTMALQSEQVLHLGTSRFVQKSRDGLGTCVVQSRQLDSIVDDVGLDTVNLVKIDVEGAEDLVLAGMEEGLRRTRYKNMILELHPPQLADRKRSIADVIGLLRGYGYCGFGLDHSPIAQRRSGYHPESDVRAFIQPLEKALADPWPHTVWHAPGASELF